MSEIVNRLAFIHGFKFEVVVVKVSDPIMSNKTRQNLTGRLRSRINSKLLMIGVDSVGKQGGDVDASNLFAFSDVFFLGDRVRDDDEVQVRRFRDTGQRRSTEDPVSRESVD